MLVSGVYKITNIVSGKIYIGSAVNLNKRKLSHKSALKKGKHQNKHLQYAWNKYKEEDFVFETIIICAKEQIRFYEQLFIDNLKPQYNQSTSAYSGIAIGSVLTKEHKEKVGIASKSHWADPIIREKNTKAIQLSMTEEECKKRSERSKLLWKNPEYRAKAIAARKGNSYNKGYKCTRAQILNRKKAARISNMKRYYGLKWITEYITRYPEHAGDVNA
jgi:group I intron endonuclease